MGWDSASWVSRGSSSYRASRTIGSSVHKRHPHSTILRSLVAAMGTQSPITPTNTELLQAPSNHGDRRPMQTEAARNDHRLLGLSGQLQASALFRHGQPSYAIDGGSHRAITGCGVPSPFPRAHFHPASASAELSDWLSHPDFRLV